MRILFLIEGLSWVFIMILSIWNILIYLIVQTYFLFIGIIGILLYSPLLLLRILLKMGVPPLHMWLLSISITIKKYELLFILTLHKLLPIIFLSKLALSTKLILVLLILSGFIVVNRRVVLMVILFSSSINTVLILFIALYSVRIILLYWILYCSISLRLFYSINRITFILILAESRSTQSAWLVLSGIPPFSLFWIKINLLINLRHSIRFLVRIIIVIIRVISLRAYYRVWHLSITYVTYYTISWSLIILFPLSIVMVIR